MKKNGKISLNVIFYVIAIVTLVFSVVPAYIVANSKMQAVVDDNIQKAVEAAAIEAKLLLEIVPGDMIYDEEGEQLIKGEVPISDYLANLKSVKSISNIDLTVFLGDTRRYSTIDGVLGTQCSDAVKATVLGKGETYFDKKVVIGGKPYYAYYTPLTDSTGQVYAMSFAGFPVSNVNAMINSFRITILVVSLIVVIVIGLAIFAIASAIRKSLKEMTEAIKITAEGNVSKPIPQDSIVSEFAQVGEDVESLRHVLNEAIRKIKAGAIHLSDNAQSLRHVAQTTNSAISRSTSAVQDISQGAAQSASDVESIYAVVEELGANTELLNSAVDQVHASAQQANDISENAKATMVKLSGVSQDTKEAVNDIAAQMQVVKNSVQNINSIVDTINGITSQTNLLSLNASIEAARAGEAGRGFAVVADEIRTLADDSAKNAGMITQIVDSLVAEINKSVSLSEKLEKYANEQVRELSATEQALDECVSEISSIAGQVEVIQGSAVTLNQAKGQIADMCSSLSAVVQQNSASSDETSTSMGIANAESEKLEENASEVADISVELGDLVGFFKTE